MVRAILHLAQKQEHEQLVGETRRLLARLAEDRFNLAVLGQFSRGKSSLMNALLGAASLPTGVLPLTSVITTVTYGESERVLLQREGWAIPQEIRLDQLAEFVTQQGNPGNAKRVTLAEVQLPNELLRLGFHFIDTPGVASPVAANTRTTRDFLPEVDAAIFVTSVESPLTEAEVNFLREVQQQVRKFFVVVNKVDLVSREERAWALRYVEEVLCETFPDRRPAVFAVSARDGLRAKQNASPELLTSSGLAELEGALTGFLRGDKAKELLLRAADRAIHLAQQEELALRISQRALSQQEADRIAERLADQIAELNDARVSLMRNIRDDLDTSFPAECERMTGLWTTGDDMGVTAELRGRFGREGSDARDERFEQVIREVCEGLYSAWLGLNRERMESLFRELAQQHLGAIEDLRAEIALTPVHVLGERWENSGRLPSPWIEAMPLAFRGIQPKLAAFPEPWWFEFLPRGRLRRFLLSRWLGKVPELVRTYREAVSASLRLAAEDWVDAVDRELTVQTERMQEHISHLLRERPDAKILPEIEAILERLRVFIRMTPGEALDTDERDAAPVMWPEAANRAQAPAQCPICLRVERALFDFLAHYQYELSRNEAEQRRHASRSGFCPLHTWQFEAIASPQGICAGYPALLKGLAAELRALGSGETSVAGIAVGVRSLLPGKASCAACQIVASTEEGAAREIAQLARTDLKAAAGVCMFHLSSILAAGPEPATAGRLLLAQALALETLAEDMQNYVLKQEATRHHLWTNAERQAALVGLIRLAGRRNTVAPWKTE